MLRVQLCVLIAFLVTDWPVTAQETKNPLALTHVTVVDCTGAPPISDMTVVVVGDRITAMGKTGDVAVPQNVVVVDASGKFLIPGLWDMHIHQRNYAWPLLIASGVTGVRVMLGDVNRLKLRDRTRSGLLQIPWICLASPVLHDRPRGMKPEESEWYQLSTADDARQAVRIAKELGYDLVKIGSNIERAHYVAIADEARRLDMPFAGHLPYSVRPGFASASGQRSLEHFWDLTVGCSRHAKTLQAQRANAWNWDKSFDIEDEAWNSYDEAGAGELFAKLVKNNTWICPTLALQYLRGNATDAAILRDPRLERVPESDRWNRDRKMKWVPRVDNERKKLDIYNSLVRLMHEAGVRFLAGTDMGNPYCFSELGLQDELDYLVKAGLTPMAALQSATRNPAEYLGRLEDVGTIETGKRADLVLLDADPLTDIRNTRRIAGVVLRGQWYSQKTLHRMVADANRTANIENAGGRYTRDLSRHGQPVNYVWLANRELDDDILSSLAEFHDLEHLNLYGTKFTDAGLGKLAGLLNLQRLFLGGSEVTDEGLPTVSGFTRLELLRLNSTQITDAGLDSISELTKLRELSLRDTRITGEGLAALQSLTDLRSLNIIDTAVDDAGAQGLEALRQLDVLWLGGTKITGVGLASIGKLDSLEELALARTQINDESLAQLSRLGELKTLYLGRTNIGDQGLRHLSGLKRIEHLALSGTRVTDAGLHHLQGHQNLRTLTLQRTQVTDAGLEHLRPLTGLRNLDLKGAPVTDAGVAKILKALPDLNITR